MLLLGCTPKGRYTEQHDIFFGISHSLKVLIPNILEFWPEANGKIHIDAWREVTEVDTYKIEIVSNEEKLKQKEKLFFINLGGYQPNTFDELHYKTLIIATSKAEAIKKVKQLPFFKTFTFKGAESHIDDQFGLDIDEVYKIEEILSEKFKKNYQIKISPAITQKQDTINLGYLKLDKIK